MPAASVMSNALPLSVAETAEYGGYSVPVLPVGAGSCRERAGLPSQGNPGVGEKGTVTSAATAVGMEPTAARVLPPQVPFDRPYLMLVTDSATGEPFSWPGSPTLRHTN